MQDNDKEFQHLNLKLLSIYFYNICFSFLGREGSVVQTVSTPISRHPAEDSTLDFTYDNAGLQVTPTSTTTPKTETTF